MFAVHRTRLRLLQVVASGGRFPTSVAIHHSLVYVLNAGDEASISGFRRNANDRLTPIPGSVRSLDLGGTTPPSFRSSPAQVGITDDGAQLLVSTKDHGAVDAFALGPDGRPASAAVTDTSGSAAANGQEATCWLVEARHYKRSRGRSRRLRRGTRRRAHPHCHGPWTARLRRIERHGGHGRQLSVGPQATHRPGGCDPRR